MKLVETIVVVVIIAIVVTMIRFAPTISYKLLYEDQVRATIAEEIAK